MDELIESNNLFQLIDQPTHIRGNSRSCIDLIITDQPNLFVDNGVHPSLDKHCHHNIIFGKMNLSVPHAPLYKRKVWDYSKADKDAIRSSISSINWAAAFSSLDVDEITELFSKSLIDILSTHIPNKFITCNEKDPPCMTSQLKTAIKRKHRVYNKYVKRGCKAEEWKHVKTLSQHTSQMITSAKEKYFLKLGQKLSDPTNGVKAYWSTLNKIINRNKVTNIPPLLENGVFVTNYQTKADVFNEFFARQCSLLPNDSSIPAFTPKCDKILSSMGIYRSKVLSLIRSLDSKKAHGCDDLSIAMLKICDLAIVEPLSLIYEMCLESGKYPSLWKKANILPIHNKESRQLKKNYRPISMLPICGKLFEKLIFDEIYDHLVKIDLLTLTNQGFAQVILQSTNFYQLHTAYILLLKNSHLEKRVLFFLIYLRHSIKSGMKACSLNLSVMVYRVPSSP